MPNPIRHLVPSLFHRRLLLLMCICLAALGLVGAQTYRLSVTQEDRHRRQAESAMVQRLLIPTIRGSITDRHGRVLAQDRPTYDIGVDYSLITERWAYTRARRRAYKSSKERWSELDFDSRERLIAIHQQPFDEQVQKLWDTLCELGGIERSELDERKNTITRKVQAIASDVWVRQLEEIRRRRGDEGEELDLSEVANPISEEFAAHALLSNVDDRVVAQVKRLVADAQARAEEIKQGSVQGPNELEPWLRVTVIRSRQREYPLETLRPTVDRSTFPGPLRVDTIGEVVTPGVAMHLIGQMRDVWEEDAKERPFRRPTPADASAIDLSGYLPGDRCGAWGLERAAEDLLRGRRGQLEEMLDTGDHRRNEPTPGRNLKLSIDVMLQARVQAVMDPQLGLMRVQPWYYHDAPSDPAVPQIGEALNGAVVVMDVPTGQVLAAVSMPSMSLTRLRDKSGELWNDRINQPYLNRTVAMPYQPGSTVKPLVLSAAITENKIGHDDAIMCNGFLEPGKPDRYRCWIYKQSLGARNHGPLHGPEAIARSCNIFFFTLGRRLGGNGIVDWYDRWGMGRATGCGLEEEVGGDLPRLTNITGDARSSGASGVSVADATQMGIGQGPVQWTPMQAVTAYAALARGGYWKSPTLYADPDSVGHKQVERDLALDPKGVEQAMQGLYEGINANYGTGNHVRVASGQSELTFNIPGVKISGKSGTAEAVPLRLVPDEEFQKTRRTRVTGEDPIVRKGDHAWMIILVQPEGQPRARYVVAVVVEYGGTGGAVAGPVANQVLHALRAEGYL